MENNHHLFSLYEKLKKEIPDTLQLSLEQLQSVYKGNTVIIGSHWKDDKTLMDFMFQYDQKTKALNVKTFVNGKEKKPSEKKGHQPAKRKGIRF